MQNLLSVIVPIKNNYFFIKSIIEKIVSMRDDSIELVIQDNTSDNYEICKYLEGLGENRVKYYHCTKNLTMSENFNLGILHSKGAFVSVLGGDDNISSKILDVVKYLQLEGVDSAVFNKAIYSWPGMKFRAHHKRPNLVIPKCSGKISKVDVEQELYKLLKAGMTSLGKLPEPYHGIVKRDALDRVYDLTNTYIPGACPDMAMAVALSHVVERHIFIDAPFSMSGQSYNSSGGKGARGEHKAELKDVNFLPSNIEATWPSGIPKIWTGPTIYADSAHNALRALRKAEILELFNYAANYANLVSFYPEYRALLKPFLQNNHKVSIEMTTRMGEIFFQRARAYLENWLAANLRVSQHKIFFDVETSYRATQIVDSFIETHFLKEDYFCQNPENKQLGRVYLKETADRKGY